jgi:site-specific recombinase XerC
MRPDPMSESVTDFARWLRSEEHKSPGTVRSYAGIAGRLQRHLVCRGITSWDEATPGLIRAWLAAGHDAGRTDGTLATWFWAAKSLFGYLEGEDWAASGHRSPMARMKAPKQELRVVPKLDVDVVKKIIAACKGSARDEAMIRVFADSGVRLAELAGMKISDLDLGDVPRVLVMGKGSKPRYVRLGDRTVLAVRRYQRQRAKHPSAHLDALWLGHCGALTRSGIYKIVTDRGRQAGVGKIHPHQLRHTFCHEFRARGGQLDDLVVLAGWAGPAMALRYGASAAAERALDAAGRYSPGDDL